ncbi:30S ribosomal protein S17 [Metallosphaera tengchongensis]|uniref:Small ribosomal subunit protein uS17 n=1 Tax=Metallosphaera tengchongensis TaxID=1532350 RepID=A0A6N0NXU7_9CREN|nr:30S ribosomal protein S17 [Metallosphaera tengchongensis]QKQ99929.1 30S ribosomal protein S17 [Metallosphaera tengchongensis]
MSQIKPKSVGIPGITPPSKECDDMDCPYHGSLRVRGILIEGTLVKNRANKMGVVERTYLFYDHKYKRYERRSSRIHAHVPPCLDIKEGDRVLIGETKPISKSVSFVVLGKR